MTNHLATIAAPAPIELGTRITRLVAAIRNFFNRRREMALLRGMDDRMLRDISLTRYDIAQCENYWL